MGSSSIHKQSKIPILVY